MKKLQNNFTTPEQAKRLLELGVPADSADCYYSNHYDYVWIKSDVDKIDWNAKVGNKYFFLPCWSVGRLNEIFKICTDICIEIYDLDLEGTQIERAMQAFEEYARDNWLDFSKL